MSTPAVLRKGRLSWQRVREKGEGKGKGSCLDVAAGWYSTFGAQGRAAAATASSDVPASPPDTTRACMHPRRGAKARRVARHPTEPAPARPKLPNHAELSQNPPPEQPRREGQAPGAARGEVADAVRGLFSERCSRRAVRRSVHPGLRERSTLSPPSHARSSSLIAPRCIPTTNSLIHRHSFTPSPSLQPPTPSHDARLLPRARHRRRGPLGLGLRRRGKDKVCSDQRHRAGQHDRDCRLDGGFWLVSLPSLLRARDAWELGLGEGSVCCAGWGGRGLGVES